LANNSRSLGVKFASDEGDEKRVESAQPQSARPSSPTSSNTSLDPGIATSKA
jgi:hypothetical protein